MMYDLPGTVHDRPDFRPVLASNSNGAPNILPPIFPLLRRYSHPAVRGNPRSSRIPRPFRHGHYPIDKGRWMPGQAAKRALSGRKALVTEGNRIAGACIRTCR